MSNKLRQKSKSYFEAESGLARSADTNVFPPKNPESESIFHAPRGKCLRMLGSVGGIQNSQRFALTELLLQKCVWNLCGVCELSTHAINVNKGILARFWVLKQGVWVGVYKSISTKSAA